MTEPCTASAAVLGCPPSAVPDFRPPIELTVLQPSGRPERSDAARNRERILCTAERLFGERGVTNVSMDEIAADAEVGKGTLYRRFGDRAGLAMALLAAQETELQEGFLRGPPPLGPGAPPRQRLDAFLAALGGFMEKHGDLITEADRTMATGARLGGPYAAHHTHVRILLRAMDPGLDIDVLAHVLLAPFRADLYGHLVERRPEGRDRLLAAISLLLDGLD